MNGYELSHNFFAWCFENPNKVSPNHVALYFFCINHCNKMGWKENFGLPTSMAKEAIGIRSYNTYIKTLNDLVEWDFIKLVEKSKNQYSANIIALSKFNKAHYNALGKATLNHLTKQSESTIQSTSESNDSIDKLQTTNNKTTNIKTLEQRKIDFSLSLNPFVEKYTPEFGLNDAKKMINKFYMYWSESNEGGKKMKFEKQKTWNLAGRLTTWANNEKEFSKKPIIENDTTKKIAAGKEFGSL